MDTIAKVIEEMRPFADCNWIAREWANRLAALDGRIKQLEAAMVVHDKWGPAIPIAWQTDTEYGIGYVFSDEFIEAFPNFPLPAKPKETP